MRVTYRWLAVPTLATLAACAPSATVPALAPASSLQLRRNFSPQAAGAYATLYSFENGTDANTPRAGLLAVGKVLYGTTSYGGAVGAGTVYRVTSAGAEHVVYSFKGGSDGANPTAGLVYSKGTLYGTTANGGTAGDGTVFAVTVAGHERIVHSFTGGGDGANPFGGVVFVKGALYGTTSNGGTNAEGTIFTTTTSGHERPLYDLNYGNGSSDAYDPAAGLTAIGDTLYGTGYYGGSANLGGVFSVTTSGHYRLLHSFTGGSDGALPAAGLFAANGVLYGTTINGGGSSGCQTSLSSGCGTVFSITTSGQERVLHAFANALTDGAQPAAPPIVVKGELYGTTAAGGATGAGSVYALTTAGKSERVLYSFKGEPTDGSDPLAPLCVFGKRLYGTASGGGVNYDNGTVFGVTPLSKR